MWSEIAIIRRILFWKYTDTVKAEHKEAEALAFLQKSVATMVGHIEGLRCAEINTNTADGEYDLVFYSELRDADALQAFQNHPLHVAHRERRSNVDTYEYKENTAMLQLTATY